MREAPFDPDDWLGPYRGHLKMVVAAGPAGRAQLLASGFPPEEIPPSPPRIAVWLGHLRSMSTWPPRKQGQGSGQRRMEMPMTSTGNITGSRYRHVQVQCTLSGDQSDGQGRWFDRDLISHPSPP